MFRQTKLPPSRKEKLQAELKLLEWHKMANNAAIKVSHLIKKNFQLIIIFFLLIDKLECIITN
jgi:hypothetical protein